MQINTVREAPGFAVARHIIITVVPPDATPFRCDFSSYATFFRSTDVLYTVKHPLNATSPLTRHATFKAWHYLATSL